MKKELSFGLSGWLGKVGSEFNEKNLVSIAYAFARYLHSNRSADISAVVVGFDGRKDSKESASLVAELLADSGVKVLLSSAVVPTPVISFTTKNRKCAAGIMITGGNHPPEYNGIEFKGSYGGPFTGIEISKVKSFLSEPGEKPDKSSRISGRKEIIVTDHIPAYLSHLETIVDRDALRLFAESPKNNPNVLIDSMGGVGQTIVEDFLVNCGWRAQTLFGSHEDNFFGRRPEAIASNLDALKYNVKVVDAQFGGVLDGDCSHCGLVSSDGNWVGEQDTFLALIRHLHLNKKCGGGVLKSVYIKGKIEEFLRRYRIPIIEAGFNLDFNELESSQYSIGNFGSGGYVFGGHIPDRDGILTILLFAEMVAMTGKPLDQIIVGSH
jgi:phosphomannomutase